MPAAAQTAGPCRLAPLATGSVASAIDARSFRLADGREIVLAGVEVPRARAPALRPGQPVRLQAADADRYGRLPALVFVNGSETPLQYTLLAQGDARISASFDDNGCLTAFRRREREAREARLGLWADPGYALRRAADGASILGDAGRLVVAEGKVVSVRERGGTIYVNFGRRWAESLTMTIARRDAGKFAAVGVHPMLLQGRNVRVRGYVEARNGPVIAAAQPSQIELD